MSEINAPGLFNQWLKLVRRQVGLNQQLNRVEAELFFMLVGGNADFNLSHRHAPLFGYVSYGQAHAGSYSHQQVIGGHGAGVLAAVFGRFVALKVVEAAHLNFGAVVAQPIDLDPAHPQRSCPCGPDCAGQGGGC